MARSLSRKKYSKGWRVVFFVVVWLIWLEHNQISLIGKAPYLDNTLISVKLLIAWWFKVRIMESNLSISNMISNIKEACTRVVKRKLRHSMVWSIAPPGLLKLIVDSSIGAWETRPGRD